jgi:predicted metal-dependent phosphoesterase TrpH
VRAEAGALQDRAIGRPHVARALVGAGHVATIGDAFDRFLGEGRPAFIARRGASPIEVVTLIRRAGGVPSLAHPGLLAKDEIIPGLAAGGLSAIEAYHGDHSPELQARYLALAGSLGLAVSGGSDYHGEASGRKRTLGTIDLPRAEFERLAALSAAPGFES